MGKDVPGDLQSIPNALGAACRISKLCCLAAVLWNGNNILPLGCRFGAGTDGLMESPRVKSKIMELPMGSSPSAELHLPPGLAPCLPGALGNTNFAREEWRMERSYSCCIGIICRVSLWPWQGRAEELHVHSTRDVQWSSDRPQDLAWIFSFPSGTWTTQPWCAHVCRNW